VSLPASLPSLVAALRLGGALVIVGVIVAQMLGAADGLGFLITRHRTLLNSPGVYAGIVLVLGITGLHEIALRGLERKVAAYRQS
jgi:NitT/TauT family transport system permease protein/taurine transport system permease protein